MAVFSIARIPGVASAFIYLAFLLKLAPAAAAPALLRTRRHGWRWFWVTVGAVVGLLVIWRHDLTLIKAATAPDFRASFGIDTLRHRLDPLSASARWASAAELGFALLPLLGFLGNARQPLVRATSLRQIAFLVGALMYCSTYVALATSYTYRLVYVIFCIPELADHASRLRLQARLGLWLMLILAFWSLLLERQAVLHHVSAGKTYGLQEIAEGLLYLFFGLILVREFRGDLFTIFRRRSRSPRPA